ncbi:MAG: hypothetical protein BV459_01920 [Thermoplasmata archaeon M11B2D]|nr:MAG: hypothetical protein BV459_01920 [Thermoplasmata archaeon M11B2D]
MMEGCAITVGKNIKTPKSNSISGNTFSFIMNLLIFNCCVLESVIRILDISFAMRRCNVTTILGEKKKKV